MRNYKDRLNPKENLEENCCEEPRIDIRDGSKVCLNCGMVFDTHFVGEERRAYNMEEVEKRKRTEPRWREFGSRTMLPVEKIDSKGHLFNAEKRTLFSRLSKIQNSLISSIERNFWEAKPKMKQLVSKMNLPAYIQDTAWRIYAACARKKLTMGRSIDGFISAALYAAIRIHEFPKLLEEVSDAALIPRRTVIRSLGLLIKEVLPELNLKYKPITIEQLIFKFGNELSLPMETQRKALTILQESAKKGLSQTGKDPKGFAACAIYMAAKKTGFRKTQAEVSEVAKITEVTLRSRVKDIKSRVSLNV
jgi:transcription initiation factor TFIIB